MYLHAAHAENISGAVYGLLVRTISEKQLLLLGAMLSSVSLLAGSFFTHNVLVLSATLGVCHGKLVGNFLLF